MLENIRGKGRKAAAPLPENNRGRPGPNAPREVRAKGGTAFDAARDVWVPLTEAGQRWGKDACLRKQVNPK
jgi:hypothetical protein